MNKYFYFFILVNNFPPLPNWCPGPLKPCFYQDIGREIPVEFQKWVRVLFYLWICKILFFFSCFKLFMCSQIIWIKLTYYFSVHAFTLAFNILAALVVLIAANGSAVTFGFSILFFVLFAPASYVCWFRPVYKGFR